MTNYKPVLSIMLLFGGESSEHEISIKSARNIHSALLQLGHKIILVKINKKGIWSEVSKISSQIKGVEIKACFGKRSFERSDGINIMPDIIFPSLHGPNGEDGTVQSVAKLLHLPCVGPSILGAAVTMDKDVTKRLLRDSGIPSAKWTVWQTHSSPPDFRDVKDFLGTPIFVKPANTGSSIGVNKVKTNTEYKQALKLASSHSDRVIIEEYIEGREIEVAVLGNDTPEATRPGEIIPGEEFYSYADKYDPKSSAVVNPVTDIEEEIQRDITRLAKSAYVATLGHGMARVDMFLKPDGSIYVGEINGIPGFTNISMYPKLWEKSGTSNTELINKLLLLALQSEL